MSTAKARILALSTARCRGGRTAHRTSWSFSQSNLTFCQRNALLIPSCRLQRTLFPEGSGYRSETGGLMQALRKLTVEQSK